MKIKEITESNYKVTASSPDKVEIASADGATKISTPPNAIQQDPSKPNTGMLDLSNINLGQPGQTQANTQTMGQPVNGQPEQSPQVTTGQAPQPGQTPPAGQQPVNGQPPQPGQPQPPQQPQLPKVGSEIELDDNIGSTIQSETVDDVNDDDLLASGKNKDVGGDQTDDFIDDVVDHKWEKNAGKSQRNVVQPDPIKESAELIAMLTIAGLR